MRFFQTTCIFGAGFPIAVVGSSLGATISGSLIYTIDIKEKNFIL